MEEEDLIQNYQPNSTSCCYCSCEELNRLIKCDVCNECFCNQQIQGQAKTHFMFHLQKSSHKAIKNSPFNSPLCCKRCGNKNIFELYLIQNDIMCSECITDKAKKKTPLIQGNNLILLNSTTKQSQVLLKDIVDKEDKLEQIGNYGFLPNVTESYKNYNEYYGTYKLLLEAERKYREEMLAKQEKIKIHIKFERKGNNYCGMFNHSVTGKIKINVLNHLIIQPVTKPDCTYRGLITNVKVKGKITIVIEQTANQPPKDGEYYVKESINFVSFERMQQALKYFCYDPKSCSRFIFNKIIGDNTSKVNSPEVLKNTPRIDLKDHELNSPQKKAVNKALLEPISLITGPPGTGKTHVASAIIYNFCKLRKNKKDKILVCSPSNVAADNLYYNLRDLNLNVIRVVSKSRELLITDESDEITYLHLELLKTSNKKFQNLLYQKKTQTFLPLSDYKQYIQLKTALEKQILQQYDIVVSTCITSYNTLLINEKFPFVVIDEVTQANEVECLIPLTHGAKKVVLIGDEHQLGPVIYNPTVLKRGLKKSLFERLKQLNLCETLLSIQYRMHPYLALFPSKAFYEGRVSSGVSIAQREDSNVMKKFIFKKGNTHNKEPTLFIHVKGTENYGGSGTSFYNEQEAEIIYKAVTKLKQCNVKDEDIGIITPYVEQKNYLLEKFEDESYIEISSVDGFQGQEKEYIFISCVRSNNENQIGFVKDERRLNVAITRARKGLIIVGNAECLRANSAIWDKLITEYAQRNILVTGSVGSLTVYKLEKFDKKIEEEKEYDWKKKNEFNFEDRRIWDDFDVDFTKRHVFFGKNLDADYWTENNDYYSKKKNKRKRARRRNRI